MEVSRRLAYYRRIFYAYIFKKKTSNLSFWHTGLATNILKENDKTGVRRYPMNFVQKTAYNTHKDSAGVIMLDYYGGNIGLQYNPNAIAQMSLGFYDLYLDSIERNDEEKREYYKSRFMEQAQWFLNMGRLVMDDILLWEYTFPFEFREYLRAPWRSALAQGQGISVCLRAYQITKDDSYLLSAQKAFNSFRYMAKEHQGGVLDDYNNNIWLEEYIVNPPNHVLNGFIWALWGVRDYAVFFNDNYAWNLWNLCVKTLRENLKSYDLGFWTCYDIVTAHPPKRPTMPCSIYYQRLHITQMKAMYALTGDVVFYDYAQRWESQLLNPLYRILSQMWKCYFKLRWF